jgi:hypothetical protein
MEKDVKNTPTAIPQLPASVLRVVQALRQAGSPQTPVMLSDAARTDAAFVRERSGFATLWAAAGHPHAVFELTCDELERLTQAQWHDVTESPAEALA